MTERDFDKLISSLKSKRPLRTIRLSHRHIGSVEQRNTDGSWEHIITIPRGQIYKTQIPEYQDKHLGVPHTSLRKVYNVLIKRGLISPEEKHKFL